MLFTSVQMFLSISNSSEVNPCGEQLIENFIGSFDVSAVENERPSDSVTVAVVPSDAHSSTCVRKSSSRIYPSRTVRFDAGDIAASHVMLHDLTVSV